jgi:hypothetical protein
VIRRSQFAFALLLALTAPAAAQERWTFCVGWASGVKDIWISDVIAASDRERLETAYKNYLEREGAAGVVAQCPKPSEDKTDVVNAQTSAEDFNRKAGAVLHAVSAQAFAPHR